MTRRGISLSTIFESVSHVARNFEEKRFLEKGFLFESRIFLSHWFHPLSPPRHVLIASRNLAWRERRGRMERDGGVTNERVAGGAACGKGKPEQFAVIIR